MVQYGPIKAGDRLWDIAGKVRPADASITRHQVMLALFRANARAFRVSCNIHSLLVVGKTLQIPSLAEMQAMSHTEAVTLFNQQQAVWKRRQKQAINCPIEEKSIVQEIVQMVGFESEKEVRNPRSVPVVTELKKPEKGKTATIPPVSSEFTSTFSLPISAVISLSIVVGLFFLALFVGWLLHKYVPLQEQVVKISEPAQENNTEFSEPLDALSQARACLAQGDTQTAKTHLTSVLNHGPSEQQQEARQLLEIAMQISTLELKATQSQQKVASEEKESTETVSHVLSKTHLPAPQYLLEDDARLSEFVGKIFTFIDHELNAQGKLAAAYHKMDKRTDINSEDYQVMEQEMSEDNQKKSRERKPTRYL
ncbi:MAG: hypothetical protein BWK79_10380 [Beggiatoa sp. IS2]|nr:MAG: hypothetical protein BWK79_10380 [Beggiatoa sp. IS2]